VLPMLPSVNLGELKIDGRAGDGKSRFRRDHPGRQIMKHILVAGLALLLAVATNAQESEEPAESAVTAATEKAAEKPAEQRELTGAEKKRLEDQIVSSMVEEYNEAVEDDLDEVVCKKERVTGSRRAVRVCKTRREIAEEEAASQRALRMRNRSSSSPDGGERRGAE